MNEKKAIMPLSELIWETEAIIRNSDRGHKSWLMFKSINHHLRHYRELMTVGVAFSIEEILRITAAAFSVSVADMKGSSRKRNLVEARSTFARLCLSWKISATEISMALNKDHSVIYHYRGLFDDVLSHLPRIQIIFKNINHLFLNNKLNGTEKENHHSGDQRG